MRCASLFSGCGGADAGMAMAGFKPVFGLEYDRAIAGLFQLNHPAELLCSDILNVNVNSIPSVELLWVSPPCPSFSIANRKRGETANDIALASHIAMLMVGANPRHIAIENVPGYVQSHSFGILHTTLVLAGYKVDSAIYNAANYGVPQTRRRFIVRASRDEWLPVTPTHSQDIGQLSPGSRKPWQTWLEAIEGIQLEAGRLTENQRKAIAIATAPQNLLIERTGYRGKPKFWQAEPAPTIRSHIHYDGKGCFRTAYNLLRSGQCLKANIQCLAAWQSFPITYKWGNRKTTAAKAIGNAVPPLLAEAIARSFLNGKSDTCKF